MNWLIQTALKLRVLVVAASFALIVFGIRSLDHVPLDVFPEFAPPVVEIQTEVPGISTEDVEDLVTIPIENGLTGIPFLKAVRSKSVLGLSSVRLIFQEGTDLLLARQLVQERLSRVTANLPASVRPRLMAIPGVANVVIWGEKDPQLQVVVDPDRLRANNITLDMVLQTVRDSTVAGEGGFIDTANQRLAVRQIPPVFTPDELGAIVVRYRNGLPLQIRDVATVVIDHAPPIGDAIINSQPGLLLIVEKQPWANTLDVTRGVESAMKELRPALGDTHYDTTIFRPATFIERSVTNLSHSMLIGCVLVVIVLFVFLVEWRSALISATVIPISLLTAVMVLFWQGGTLNTMVLAGLVIALGEVVDDAIIDVENIIRRLRLNSLLATPLSSFQVVLQASLEVRSAVVYGTMIVVLAFLPVFFLEGLAGSFFRPLARSYILAILSSPGMALTLTPALSLMLLPKAASRFGLTPGALMRSVGTLVNGTRVGEIFRDQKIFGVVVRGEPHLSADVTSLRELMIDTPSGAQVPLHDVADIRVAPAPNEIKREGASRRIDVSCNVDGRDLGSVATEIEQRVLEQVQFPSGYHPEFLGEYAEAKASQQRILLMTLFALIAIVLVLYVDFQSWRMVMLITLLLPFALLGGVVGVLLTGGIVSLGSLFGFVTVLGIAARNGIMLLSHYRHLQTDENVAFGRELVLRGAEERLSPILMTALTTGLALVPLIVSGNIPGQEIEFPMAYVILGGLVTATLLNLFVLPVIYLAFAPASLPWSE